MKNVFKEALLCFLVSVLTIVLFVVLALVYDANEHTILVNILVWTGLVLLSYLTFIFIPFWKKKRTYYIDLLAFAFGYIGVLVVCLAKAKTLDEYSYVSVLPFISSFLGTAELIISTQRTIEEKTIGFKGNDVLAVFDDEPLELKKNVLLLITHFDNGKDFTIEQAMSCCKKRKRSIERILLLCEEKNVLNKKILPDGSITYSFDFKK